MHIFLTGFMGAGKSYTGRRLASLLDVAFIDLDERIEVTAGTTINTIFADQGEQVFRQLEADTLRSLQTEIPGVVATGGGAPCYHDNMDWMNANGTTVFLDPPLSILVQRLEAGRSHRPLLHTADELAAFVQNKLESRRSDYEKAKIHLRPTDPEADVARLLHAELVSTFLS
ncbi:MAG: shikimate kinase [Bacteroidota bacterium]